MVVQPALSPGDLAAATDSPTVTAMALTIGSGAPAASVPAPSAVTSPETPVSAPVPADDQGDAAGQYSLAVMHMYVTVTGVPHDYKEASRLFKLAADQRYQPARDAFNYFTAVHPADTPFKVKGLIKLGRRLAKKAQKAKQKAAKELAECAEAVKQKKAAAKAAKINSAAEIREIVGSCYDEVDIRSSEQSPKWLDESLAVEGDPGVSRCVHNRMMGFYSTCHNRLMDGITKFLVRQELDSTVDMKVNALINLSDSAVDSCVGLSRLIEEGLPVALNARSGYGRAFSQSAGFAGIVLVFFCFFCGDFFIFPTIFCTEASAIT